MIICVDFDGTCVKHEFPKIGEDVPGCVQVLKELVDLGCKLILFTIRSDILKPQSDDYDIKAIGGKYLSDAVNWFSERDIPLYAASSMYN